MQTFCCYPQTRVFAAAFILLSQKRHVVPLPQEKTAEIHDVHKYKYVTGLSVSERAISLLPGTCAYSGDFDFLRRSFLQMPPSISV